MLISALTGAATCQRRGVFSSPGLSMISAVVSPVLPCISRVKYLLLVANTSVIVNIFKKKKNQRAAVHIQPRAFSATTKIRVAMKPAPTGQGHAMLASAQP